MPSVRVYWSFDLDDTRLQARFSIVLYLVYSDFYDKAT